MNGFLKARINRNWVPFSWSKVIVMKSRHRVMSASAEIRWQFFWLLEVVFLATPTFITIVVFRRSDPVLTPHRLAVLFAVLIGLTAFNVILNKRRNAQL